jgi:hypothetical protein
VLLVYLVLLGKEVIQMETDALSELVACNLDWEFLSVLAGAPFANLPPPITEMVPPTTASLAVLPIISDIFFECPDEPR